MFQTFEECLKRVLPDVQDLLSQLRVLAPENVLITAHDITTGLLSSTSSLARYLLVSISSVTVEEDTGFRFDPRMRYRVPTADFDASAILLFQHAFEESSSSGCPFIGTEHLLIVAAANPALVASVPIPATVEQLRLALQEFNGDDTTYARQREWPAVCRFIARPQLRDFPESMQQNERLDAYLRRLRTLDDDSLCQLAAFAPLQLHDISPRSAKLAIAAAIAPSFLT